MKSKSFFDIEVGIDGFKGSTLTVKGCYDVSWQATGSCSLGMAWPRLATASYDRLEVVAGG